MEEVKNCINMGIGELGNPDVNFSRSFRWLLEADNLSSSFCKSVEFDYKNKLIKFEYYDVIAENNNMQGLLWADTIQRGFSPNEKMKFTALDGIGKEIYSTEFYGLELIEHKSVLFDYVKSDIATQFIVIKYDKMAIKVFGNEKPTNEVRFDEGANNWTIQLKDKGDTLTLEIPALIEDRPELSIEETELNFLNAKTWIPGKPVWQILEMRVGVENIGAVNKAFFTNGKHNKIQVVLNYKKGQKKIETWNLHGAFLQSYGPIDVEKKECRYVIRYDKVVYSPSV